LITDERVCSDLDAALDQLRGAGFRLDSIYPADDPHTAVLSRGGEIVRLTTRPGTAMPARMPPFDPQFVLTRAGSEGGKGRAGMFYRDLIPGRLGGRYIASHITISDGGPVADWVHYHHVAMQIIAVRKGWVRVVYEDQGEPFVLEAGDLVLQPPGIRHRVLESSPALEVVEISAPAMHETFADHELELPNARGDAQRKFDGQRFLRHVAALAPWTSIDCAVVQETGLGDATNHLGDARFVRLGQGQAIDLPPGEGELVFGFVMEGSGRLVHGQEFALWPTDAFVIPPGDLWGLRADAGGLTMLHVTTARLG
jgi:quercetin dioxygenase-like cupin family protein